MDEIIEEIMDELQPKGGTVGRFLNRANIAYSGPVDRGDYSAYELDECPWGDQHSSGNRSGAAAFVDADGKMGFGCFRCKADERVKGWRQFREYCEKITPGSTPRPMMDNDQELIVEMADHIAMKKVRWLWPGRIPIGKLTLFTGDPGKAKSLMGVYVAAANSTGQDYYDVRNANQPGETLLLVGEDDLDDTAVPRLVAAGANLGKIHIVKSVLVGAADLKNKTEREFALDTGLKAVRQYWCKHPGINLMIVDPITNFLGPTKMHNDQAVRAVLIPLKGLAADLGIAIVCIMHLNKKEELKMVHRVGGSMGFVGVARAVWLFDDAQVAQDDAKTEGTNPESSYEMLPVKCNLTRKQGGLLYTTKERGVQIEGSEEMIPYIDFIGESTATNAGNKMQGKLGSAKDWVYSYQAKNNSTVEEMLTAGEKAGFTRRTLERARQGLAENEGPAIEI